MLKIVHTVCCGVDVHKKFIVATLASTDSKNITTYKTKTFKTFTHNLIEFKNWLLSNNCTEMCMESTGKYWIPIYNILEDSCNITLANPKFIRNIPGKKTDKRDSIWIADLHKHGLVRGSFIPPKQIRELRDLRRYRSKLINFRSSEKNRIQNSLTVSNLMISSVVSDTFGKTASAIIKYALEHPNNIDIDYTDLLHGRLLPKAEEINLSMKGSISTEQSAKMKVAFNHFDYINNCLDQLDNVIDIISKDYQEQISLLSTIPGINPNSAVGIISEIGIDMIKFDTSKHLCSWAGLTPQNNESAGKKKSVRISRAGVYLKPLLVQCANAAIKDKSCPYFKYRYESIKKRRGHKRSIIAISRMLLTCCYNMLLNNEEFNSSLYDYYLKDCIKPTKTIDKMIRYLQSQGFTVQSEVEELVGVP